MASSARDVLPLSRAKLSLRLTGDTDHDDLITAYIDAAVALVDDYTRIGVLARSVTVRIPPPTDADEVRLLVPAHAAVTAVEITATESAGPLGTAIGTGLTRVGRSILTVAPPLTGWPTDAGEWIEISYALDIEGLNVPGALVAAAELLVRAMYDGRERIDPTTWAAVALMRPYMQEFAGDAISEIAQATTSPRFA